jgi:hypothetical protein
LHVFACETSHDPLLARSDKFIRAGALVAPLGLCTVAMTARLLDPTRHVFVVEMLCLSAIGQALVWWGLNGVRRSKGWDSGVVSYVWTGGILNAMAVSSTEVLVLSPIPLIAPLVAAFARQRFHRKVRRWRAL